MSIPSNMSSLLKRPWSILAIATLSAAFVAPAHAAPRLTGEEQLQKMVAGRIAGKPVDCLSQTPLLDSQKIEGVGLVYRMGNTLYVNRFQDGCPSLTAFTTIVTKTYSSQLCRGDIARLVDLTTRIESGSCALGQFTPYSKPK